MVVLPVRFERSPRLHSMQSEEAHAVGTKVVVQGKRGPEVATVRGEPSAPRPTERYGAVLRAATTEDLERWEELHRAGEDLKWLLRARARERQLPVKLVAVEFTLDESLVTVSYSADERIELTGLIGEVRAHTRARVNFAAIGPREQAQMLGTLGACGRENCSSTHLQEFAPVSIRMARDQQLPLNPEKLSGPCGRLLCCLQFEHTQYVDLLKNLPRKNAKVCHDGSGACGKVTKLHPLSGTVDVFTEQGMLLGVPATELRRAPDEGSTRAAGERGHKSARPPGPDA
ncbi:MULTISPECIES: PSP1 domain-containing protein [Deinococcus]|uniref:Stage 0 sporulation family protein n=1 Tax=Deinococcus rufus TaxID=2136097 RepID=A0ABV7Z9D4_9DEIO|nr:stage 0 sporulation family protein [Deinococcus sp. AB2017081]WQE96104.1 stage 0 sporulation family protein [Deinococcus sp. AB2017081]